MKANWRAMSLVTAGKSVKNRWHCSGCTKACTALLPLSEEPNANCNGGHNERPASH